MAELGIIPAPADSGPYLELAKSPTGRVFRKHILNLGPLIHPKTGKVLQLDEQFYDTLKRNFDNGVSMVQVPLADDKNQHSEAPDRNTGEVVGLEKDGSKVYALLDIRDPAVAEKLADKRLMGASAMISMDYTDTSTGRKVGPALLHSCITNRPYVVGLEDYAEVVAACAQDVMLPDGTVWSDAADPLMLCASEVEIPGVMLSPAEPDYQDDYQRLYGGPDMHDDFLRDESARLGLLAYQESSGRPSKPSYDHVAVAREHEERQQTAGLTAEEITEEDCHDYAMRLVALTGLPFADLMAAGREIAFDKDEATAREYRSVAGGLVELTARLGYDTDRLRGDDLVALAAVAEESRLDSTVTLAAAQQAESDRLVALARHPSKSGKLLGTEDRAHSEDEDPSDSGQPGRGGRIHPEVARMLAEHRKLFGNNAEDADAGSHGSKSHPPKSPAQRHLEETYGLAGGRPGGRSIPDLARGSRQVRSGR